MGGPAAKGFAESGKDRPKGRSHRMTLVTTILKCGILHLSVCALGIILTITACVFVCGQSLTPAPDPESTRTSKLKTLSEERMIWFLATANNALEGTHYTCTHLLVYKLSALCMLNSYKEMLISVSQKGLPDYDTWCNPPVN
jgi:hypothetical protein